MAEALINGRSYSATDIRINIAGAPVNGVKAITINETQERPNNYSFGSSNPTARGSARREYTCSIDLDYKTTLFLRNASPTRSLLDLRDGIGFFTILVTLDNGVAADFTTITVKNCEFTKDGLESAIDDSEAVMSYDLSIAGLVYL